VKINRKKRNGKKERERKECRRYKESEKNKENVNHKILLIRRMRKVNCSYAFAVLGLSSGKKNREIKR
jgi:hypothetical protein